MVKIQLRGDTLEEWEKYNPVIAEREMILIASNVKAPDDYDLYKIGDGKRKFKDLPYHGLPAVQERGNSFYDVMSQRAVTGELVVLEEKLKKIQVDILNSVGDGHTQNTDTGTDSRRFLINDVLLKCCCHDLVLRSACDCDYADLTVKDLYVMGKMYLNGGIIETEVEQVKTKSNLIILNEGETGAGVATGLAGLMIDRGTEDNYYILFEETDKKLKAGIGGALYAIPFIGGDFQQGDVPAWDEEKGVFVPRVVEEPEEKKNYAEILPPFAGGEIPVWDEEQEIFIPGKGVPDNCMLLEGEIEDGDAVVWNADKGAFVSGIPYDALNMRKDRIMVYAILPTIGMLEGDIVIIDKDAPPPPGTEEEAKRKSPYLMKSDIADDLDTDNAARVLSARQGYILGRTNADKTKWGNPDDFKKGFRGSIDS